MKRITDTKSFVEKANIVHKGKYTYDKVVWVRSKDKIVITCPEHGDFEQSSNNHISGNGCTSCGRFDPRRKTSPEEWVRRAKDIHGDEFQYHLFNPDGVFDKSTLICNHTNEEFQISPDNLVNGGKKCSCCKGKRITEALKLPYAEANTKLQEKHPHLSILESSYIKFSSPCTVLCKEHGAFVKTPQTIMPTSKGCEGCNVAAGNIRHRPYTESEFIAKSFKSHPHIDFTDCGYKTQKSHVRYTCKVHNFTDKVLANHVGNSVGMICPICNRSALQEKLVGFYNEKIIERNLDHSLVYSSTRYLIHLPNLGENVYKIGIAHKLSERLGVIGKACGGAELVDQKPNNLYNCFYSEQELHTKFKGQRFISPIEFGGHTELFTLSSSDVDYIKDYKVEDRGGNL